MIRNFYRHKLLRYGFIGGISTLIHMGVAFGWLYWANGSVIISNMIGFMSAYLFSYTAQSLVVFSHPLSTPKAVRYFIVQFAALWISIGLTAALQNSPYLKTLLIVAIMPLATYTIHRIWTFKHHQEN